MVHFYSDDLMERWSSFTPALTGSPSEFSSLTVSDELPGSGTPVAVGVDADSRTVPQRKPRRPCGPAHALDGYAQSQGGDSSAAYEPWPFIHHAAHQGALYVPPPQVREESIMPLGFDCRDGWPRSCSLAALVLAQARRRPRMCQGRISTLVVRSGTAR